MTAPRNALWNTWIGGFLLLCLGGFVRDANAALAPEWQYLETDEVVTYFPSYLSRLAPHVTKCVESALQTHSRVLGYQPDNKVIVELADSIDNANASAGVMPRESLLFYAAPVDLAFESFSSGERFCNFANHETTHLANNGQASPEDAWFRDRFKGIVAPWSSHPETILYAYLTAPRTNSPRWLIEGAATFMETWLGGGLGRAQGAYDEMVFRAMVKDGAEFYDPLGLVSQGTELDFRAGANNYLYGTRFQSYLALQYSPESLFRWWQRQPGTLRDYKDQFEVVYGRPLEQAWQEWVSWEQAFQQANLAEVRKHPITPAEPLSNRALGSVSRAHEDTETGEVYVGVRFPGVVAHLAAVSLRDGSVRQLTEVEGPMHFRVTALAFDRERRRLLYTNDNNVLRDLMEYDLSSGKSRMLIENARVGELVFHQGSRTLWGLRGSRGRVSLVRFNEDLSDWTVLHTFPLGLAVYDLDISPDGRWMSASFGRINGDQSVRVLDIASLEAGETAPLYSFEMGTSVPESFVFSADGRFLLGSSYYTGISNIYRYDLERKELEALSNAETGFFRPTELADGSLMVLNYTGDGFLPSRIEARPLTDLSAVRFLGAQIAKQHPAVRDWTAAPVADIDLGSRGLKEGVHDPLASMGLDAVYPVLQGYKDAIGGGLVARLSDPMRISRLDLSLSYTPDGELDEDERLHARARWDYHRLWAEASWNRSDFYDLFGPTKTGRKGYTASVGYRWPLIYDLPRRLDLTTEVSLRGGLDTLPDFQNVESSFDRLWLGKASLVYQHLRRSQGAVDDEAGHLWGLHSRVYEAEGELYASLHGQLDVGFPLPIDHSSLWWRSALGASSGNRDSSLANQYFGGFGNNYVDRLDAKQYREVDSLPGFEIDEVAGRSFAKSMLEWNLPPLRFRQLGSPGFYARYLRPALFTTVLVTDPDDGRFRRTFYNLGAQVDFAITFLERRSLTLSLGYAVGFEEGGESSDEFMLSLKIL